VLDLDIVGIAKIRTKATPKWGCKG